MQMEDNVTVLAKSMEKYSSISCGRYRFVDSANHLSASLDSLAEKAVETVDPFLLEYIDTNFPCKTAGGYGGVGGSEWAYARRIATRPT